MDLFYLLAHGITAPKRKLFLMLIAAGFSNAGVIFAINAASAHADKPSENTAMMLLFVATIAVYALSQRYIMVVATGQVEAIIHDTRKRLINKLLRCELRDVEAIGPSRLQDGLGKHTQTISQFATPMVLAGQAAVMVTFALGYIAWLSVATFVASIAFLGIALTLYFRRLDLVTAGLQKAAERERELQDALRDILSGFKEIKINSRRSAAISEDAENVSYRASWLRTEAQTGLARNFVFAQISLFMLLATGVFIVPLFSHTENSVVTKTTMAVLFLIGPISGLVACVPVFVNANAAARDLGVLEGKLDALLQSETSAEAPSGLPLLKFRPIPIPFDRIVLDNVVFRHIEPQSGEAAFSVGPLNLEIKAGEITFIVGGNGSGKSTLLKLLTGLYQPDSGTILVDSVPITRTNLQDYRDLFWTVFSDYHLFRRFYGIDSLDSDEAARMIEDFELSAKTAIAEDRFQTVDLSGGQRRRLALMAALFEKRPIGVLDEWAADQDPHFRRKFYQEILPAMKAKGMTMVVVTHDDRYFDVCDRLIKLDEGRVIDAEVKHA